MEFPDLGKQCAKSDCQQLDFLPFKCGYCQKSFCEAHWKVLQHSCPRQDLIRDRRVPDCPLCGEIISMGPHEDPNTVVERHIRAGKCRTNRAASEQPPQKSRGEEGWCGYRKCKDKPLVLVECSYCRNKYCLKHRFEGDHECTKRRGGSVPVVAASRPMDVKTAANTHISRVRNMFGNNNKAGKKKDDNCIVM